MQAVYAETVKASLNFAANRTDLGEWSNTNPARTRQNLLPVKLDIRNARAQATAPSLEREGLTIANHPVPDADWLDNDWITSVYLPSCEALVQELTGAKACASIFVPLQRRVDFGEQEGSIPSAHFVHLDNTVESALPWAEPIAESLGLSLEHAVIYNVWKSTTPPPQDCPLAVADLRSIPESDHVDGAVVEEFEDRKIVSPYVGLLHSSEQVYYYYPDVQPDESLVFLGLNFDTDKKLGCAHAAFKYPQPVDASVARRSIESRVLAFFD